MKGWTGRRGLRAAMSMAALSTFAMSASMLSANQGTRLPRNYQHSRSAFNALTAASNLSKVSFDILDSRDVAFSEKYLAGL